MRFDRTSVGALAASASLLVGGGTALAASGQSNPNTRCEALLAKIAERRGVTVEQLEASVKARLLAGVDRAEQSGRLSPERAAQMRERIRSTEPCSAPKRVQAPVARGGMLKAAAVFLGLDRGELRAQLPGNSLAGLATKQGKRPAALEAAMVAPAKARLARAVANEKLTERQAARVLAALEAVAHRLATKVFPAR